MANSDSCSLVQFADCFDSTCTKKVKSQYIKVISTVIATTQQACFWQQRLAMAIINNR